MMSVTTTTKTNQESAHAHHGDPTIFEPTPTGVSSDVSGESVAARICRETISEETIDALIASRRVRRGGLDRPGWDAADPGEVRPGTGHGRGVDRSPLATADHDPAGNTLRQLP